MSLELKKKQLEMSRVKLAREELELKIQEREEEIRQLRKYIEAQLAKETELFKELEALNAPKN
jgi:hypothetical protein